MGMNFKDWSTQAITIGNTIREIMGQDYFLLDGGMCCRLCKSEFGTIHDFAIHRKTSTECYTAGYDPRKKLAFSRKVIIPNVK